MKSHPLCGDRTPAEAATDEIVIKHRRIADLLSEVELDALVLSTAGSLSWLLAGARVNVSAAGEPILSALVTRDRIHLGVFANEVERIIAEELSFLSSISGLVVVHPIDWHAPLGSFTKHVKGAETWSIGLENDWSVRLRAVRTPLLDYELARYRQLCLKSARAMTDVLNRAAPDQSEIALTADLAASVRGFGAEPLVLLASGESRSRYRHPLPTTSALGRRAMLVVCAREHGLIANVTRWVRFGEPTAQESDVEEAILRVEADVFDALQPGLPLKEMMSVLRASYARWGFDSGEWTRHHQGGAAGYVGRDPRLTPEVEDTISDRQAFTWNPSAYSAAANIAVKTEDTVVFDSEAAQSVETLTADERWPTVSIAGRRRPATLHL